MNKEIILSFNNEGQMKTLYNENIELEALGKLNIKRASHVEPTNDGLWTADLTPIGGPILGPFKKRSIALEEEVNWINNNILSSK